MRGRTLTALTAMERFSTHFSAKDRLLRAAEIEIRTLAPDALRLGPDFALLVTEAQSIAPDGLTPEEQKRILGSQGNVWTEYMLTPDHVEYMMHPRMEALAEVLWTGPRKSEHLPDFH